MVTCDVRRLVVKFKKRLRSLDEFPSGASALDVAGRGTKTLQKLGFALLIAAAFCGGLFRLVRDLLEPRAEAPLVGDIIRRRFAQPFGSCLIKGSNHLGG
ncbi:hypothetical protein C8K44_11529 [Aminobacter sp. AP02]|nr:hypothetical protein C8K44_11529 [Aminobacter sp. AP02]